MNPEITTILSKFQELIKYKFKQEELLKEALTTPQLANEIGINDYNFLETLGDAVLKIIFITKLYNDGKGIRDPGTITKIKQKLENDNILRKIALEKMNLDKFIFKSEKQKIKNTKVLADVFEAICGALYLDSGRNINLVEKKIVNRFYTDYSSIISSSKIFIKNELIEYLQKKFRITPRILCEYENLGTDNEPKWVAKNPKIFPEDLKITLPKDLISKKSSSIGGADQDIYEKILMYLRRQYF
ncbi:MAG: ribonuclease III family protein [Candidatus Lokiarchaeota archaeon]|nr:ribonuclease III family protein [Candidatus Lokiarchaeota archaeon]